MRIAIIAFTPGGYALGEKLEDFINASGKEALLCRCQKGGLEAWTSQHFSICEALVFIGAAGIAVRAIAPYVRSKLSDPAVVVMDELGKFVVPLLSGHIGGGNRLARELAEMLGAVPVITTATDCHHVFSVDTWAVENQIHILNPERIKEICASLLSGERVGFKSLFPVNGKLPEGIVESQDEYRVILTVETKGRKDALRLVPPVLTLGIGCKKGVSWEEIDRVFTILLEKSGCYKEGVCCVCSIDMKAQEPGILAFCQTYQLPFETFSQERLKAVEGDFTSSEFVREITGVDNVCERSAVLGSGGKLLVRKQRGKGVTMALAIAPYTISFAEEI